MKKIGLLICGNSGIDYVDIDYPMEVIRAKLFIDGKEYEDFVDITVDEFYKILDEQPNVRTTTAQPATGEILEKVERLKKQGYTDIISIMISSGLAGNYQHVVFASSMVTGVNMHVIDSLSVSYGQVFLVHEAVRLIKEGLDVLEIVERLEEYKKRIKIFVLVKDLRYLIRSGRLSIAKGMAGILLRMKPILTFNEEGGLYPSEKIRTYKKARERLIQLALELIEQGVLQFGLGYTNNEEEVLEIKEELLTHYPDLDIVLFPLTPVVGSHAGPGTYGVGAVMK